MTPAERIAGAHCIIARHRGRATAFHPARCRFCATPLEQLEVEVHREEDGMTAFMQIPEKRRAELIAQAAFVEPTWIDEL